MISLQEVEREETSQDLVGVVLFGDGGVEGASLVAPCPRWNLPYPASLKPRPPPHGSLPRPQAPLERHAGGIRPADSRAPAAGRGRPRATRRLVSGSRGSQPSQWWPLCQAEVWPVQGPRAAPAVFIVCLLSPQGGPGLSRVLAPSSVTGPNF